MAKAQIDALFTSYHSSKKNPSTDVPVGHFIRILNQRLVLGNLIPFILLAKHTRLDHCHQIPIERTNHDPNLETCRAVPPSKTPNIWIAPFNSLRWSCWTNSSELDFRLFPTQFAISHAFWNFWNETSPFWTSNHFNSSGFCTLLLTSPGNFLRRNPRFWARVDWN